MMAFDGEHFDFCTCKTTPSSTSLLIEVFIGATWRRWYTLWGFFSLHFFFLTCCQATIKCLGSLFVLHHDSNIFGYTAFLRRHSADNKIKLHACFQLLTLSFPLTNQCSFTARLCRRKAKNKEPFCIEI